ncbi:MAG: DUF418 domain-containing protein [Chloroflexota bacterium]
MTTPSETLQHSETRVNVIDVLRGFALFGIFMVNMTVFARPIYEYGITMPTHTAVDSFITWLISFGFETKFYVLFSFLFGYGLAIQLTRTTPQNDSVGARYTRRLIGLLVLGALHAIFFFFGDILVSYVILGIFLWLIRGWAPRRLVWVALAMMGVAVVGRILLAIADHSMAFAGDASGVLLLAEEARRNYLGSFGQGVYQRLQDLVLMYIVTPLLNWPTAFAMFALGLAAGKINFFKNLDQHLPTMRRWLPWVFALAIIGNGAYWLLYSTEQALVYSIILVSIEAFAAPALTFCYVFVIIWIVQRSQTGSWLNPLRAAGRMSLTNYLGQAIICSFLFNGWGLGWYGSVNPSGYVVLVVIIFIGQVWLSNWWLQHFSCGPDEWLLRSWTYLQWQPFRNRRIEA